MTDKRIQRAWIKVQLTDSEQSHEAALQVSNWKLKRQATQHVVKAIRLYVALCRGDLSVLEEYFPGFLFGVANRPAQVRQTNMAAPSVEEEALIPDTDDLESVLDGIGLSGLNFDT